MKKMIVMAAVCMASSLAFAGDSQALRDVLKAKTYEEAASLVKANIGQMTDAAEKAKAYNYLVDLAMKTVTKETTIMTENQLAAQTGIGKEKAYDTLALGNAICQALEAAMECNKYDQQPNAKGQVKPKFAEKNATRVWPVRPNLVNIGQEEARKNNNDGVLKYWGAFLDSDGDPLFAAQDHKAEEGYIGQVAYFTGRYAFDAKQYDRANRYLDIAMRDPEQKKDALNFKLYASRSNLKTHADSLQFVDELKKLYQQDPENDVVLDGLYNMYDGLKDKEAQAQLLDQHLAKYPNSFTALADKGMMAIAANDADAGASWLRKAAQVKPDNAVVQTYLGTCLSVQAGNTDDAAKRKALYQEAIQALDKAKELDPTKTQANWGYNRYQAYYGLYGADDPKTQAAEAESR